MRAGPSNMRLIACLAFLLAAGWSVGSGGASVFESERARFTVRTVVEGLDHPWSVAFLPDGGMLITERPGRLRRVADGRLLAAPIGGLPEVAARGQGGLLDVVLDPRFADNRLVYLSYAARDARGDVGTEVARGRLAGDRLEAVRVLFRALPKSSGGRHFGSRLLFAPDGNLLITLGERGEQDRAQDRGDHAGSIIRIAPDGTVPADNPFVAAPGVRPEILTWGNRNVQGIALEPGTGRIWAHEHGPQGGDEVNLVVAGTNYGWPVITYGRNYGTGTRIGVGESGPGMAPPVFQWTPSIAPSGMAFYHGDRFPAWRGNLFVGALKYQMIVRLEIAGERIVHEERLVPARFGRIRDVRSGPDGYLYFLTDESDGILARFEPF